MSDDDYSEATPEQKLHIATYFIMSAPVGEVDEVSSDVVKLVGDSKTLNDAALNAILRDYNTEQMTVAPDLHGKPVLVSKFGQVGNNLYLDPSSGKVLKFDHQRRAFTEETDKKQVLSEKVDAYRRAISTAIDKYLDDQFKANKCVQAIYGADNGAITICMSAKNVNLSNYWTGSWRSVYTMSVNGSSTELKGNVKANVHYFEDGNVQLHTTIDHQTQISLSGNAEAVAARVAEAINKFETEFQNNLEEMYVNMHRTTFKAMRRFLPVQKTKFLWSSAAHSLASEVSK